MDGDLTWMPADLVQDLYLKELKNYKVPPTKANDAEGIVQKFKIPQTPKSPEESSLANDLSAYETQTVEVEGSSSDGTPAVEEDWFVEVGRIPCCQRTHANCIQEEEDEPAKH